VLTFRVKVKFDVWAHIIAFLVVVIIPTAVGTTVERMDHTLSHTRQIDLGAVGVQRGGLRDVFHALFSAVVE
jgi:hypothetical protein